MLRTCFDNICAPWSKVGHPIGLGLAIASGYATLGLVGHQGRADYTAIGGVVNVASRLCDKASHGQILLTHRAYLDVESHIQAKSLGLFELSDVKNAIEVYAGTQRARVRHLNEAVLRLRHSSFTRSPLLAEIAGA